MKVNGTHIYTHPHTSSHTDTDTNEHTHTHVHTYTHTQGEDMGVSYRRGEDLMRKMNATTTQRFDSMHSRQGDQPHCPM